MPSLWRSPGHSLELHKEMGTAEVVCSPESKEVEAGRPDMHAHPLLQSKLKASLILEPVLKQTNEHRVPAEVARGR